MGIKETVKNGNNVTVADDRIFDFVYKYARLMGEMEEVEHNLLMLNQPYSTYDSQQDLMTIEMLNINYDYIEGLYEEMDEFAQAYYKSNMETYRKRTLVLINLIDKWQKSSVELNLAKQG